MCNIKKPFAYFSAFPLGFPINIRPRDHMIDPNIITRYIETVVSLLSLLSYVTAEENGQKLLIRDLSSHPWFPPQANLQLTKESIKNCFFSCKGTYFIWYFSWLPDHPFSRRSGLQFSRKNLRIAVLSFLIQGQFMEKVQCYATIGSHFLWNNILVAVKKVE